MLQILQPYSYYVIHQLCDGYCASIEIEANETAVVPGQWSLLLTWFNVNPSMDK